jgi:hypothetical protein
MPRDQAYRMLLGMEGKLEKALLTSFKEVALRR